VERTTTQVQLEACNIVCSEITFLYLQVLGSSQLFPFSPKEKPVVKNLTKYKQTHYNVNSSLLIRILTWEVKKCIFKSFVHHFCIMIYVRCPPSHSITPFLNMLVQNFHCIEPHVGHKKGLPWVDIGLIPSAHQATLSLLSRMGAQKRR